MSEGTLYEDSHKRFSGTYAHDYRELEAIHETLKKMARESPRCVVLGIYENDTGYLFSHITNGTILDPEPFSLFMAQVHSTAEEAMAARFNNQATECKHLNPVSHVIVETERFVMISRRMNRNLSLILVLRAPVECMGMPIDLLDRLEGRLLEMNNGLGDLPVS